jgi:putative nucleotidyltransferase with HDIG domain
MRKSQALQRIGDRITLPAVPEVVRQITAMVADSRVGMREIGVVVGRDPALTAMVLKIANSSFYGLSEPVLGAEEATAIIGAHSIKGIALQASLMKRYERFSETQDFDLDELWSHSLWTARLARALAELTPERAGLAPDDFYTCGLLHDVGKVILLEGLEEEYLDLVRTARLAGKALHLVEREEFGFTHIDVGTLLAARWQLPDQVATAIEFHHGPREAILESPAAAVVSIADQVAYRARSRTFESVAPRLAALGERVLRIRPERFDGILELARSQAETAAAW